MNEKTQEIIIGTIIITFLLLVVISNAILLSMALKTENLLNITAASIITAFILFSLLLNASIMRC